MAIKEKFDEQKNGKIVALKTGAGNEVIDCLLSMKKEQVRGIKTG